MADPERRLAGALDLEACRVTLALHAQPVVLGERKRGDAGIRREGEATAAFDEVVHDVRRFGRYQGTAGARVYECLKAGRIVGFRRTAGQEISCDSRSATRIGLESL